MTKILFIILFISLDCGRTEKSVPLAVSSNNDRHVNYTFSGEIEPPYGYDRIAVNPGSFGEWLRKVPLKKDGRVYLYNGSLKKDQSVQYAVLDVRVGDQNLQQCADAVMRLRAEFLFVRKRFREIVFIDNNNKRYQWEGSDDRLAFEQYLRTVFGWCGSASLEKQLKPVENKIDMMPGDVFVQGGFPGHAMIVMDVAVNKSGKKLYMLAQSYMPAQDIHIVRNPGNEKLSPWYELNDKDRIITPEWSFYKNQLRSWE